MLTITLSFSCIKANIERQQLVEAIAFLVLLYVVTAQHGWQGKQHVHIGFLFPKAS